MQSLYLLAGEAKRASIRSGELHRRSGMRAGYSVKPCTLPCLQHGIRISGTAETAVVTAERAEEIAFFEVEIMAKDDASESED